MDRTKVAINAEAALRDLERMYDDIDLATRSGQAAPAAPALAAAADHLALIFDYPGADEIADAVAKAVDKLALVAQYIRDLANAKPEIDRTEMLDPALEYLRLLRDAEERATKGETPDRVHSLLNIADRYLADALHSAYRRRKDADADTKTPGTPDIARRTPENGETQDVQITLPRTILDALNQLAASMTEPDYDGTSGARRIRQAASLEANAVPDALVVIMCRISARGRMTADDVAAIYAALPIATPEKDA